MYRQPGIVVLGDVKYIKMWMELLGQETRMLGGIKYIKMWTDLKPEICRKYLKVRPRQTTANVQCRIGTHHLRNLYPDPG